MRASPLLLERFRKIDQVGALHVDALRIGLALARLDLAPSVAEEVDHRVSYRAVRHFHVREVHEQLISALPHADRAALAMDLGDEVVDALELLRVEDPGIIYVVQRALASVGRVRHEDGAVQQEVVDERGADLVLLIDQVRGLAGDRREVDRVAPAGAT